MCLIWGLSLNELFQCNLMQKSSARNPSRPARSQLIRRGPEAPSPVGRSGWNLAHGAAARVVALYLSCLARTSPPQPHFCPGRNEPDARPDPVVARPIHRTYLCLFYLSLGDWWRALHPNQRQSRNILPVVVTQRSFFGAGSPSVACWPLQAQSAPCAEGPAYSEQCRP